MPAAARRALRAAHALALLALAALLVAAPSAATAQGDLEPLPGSGAVMAGEAAPTAPAAGRATATRAEARRAVRAPTVDGRDDDPVWRDAQVIDEFLEYEPTPAPRRASAPRCASLRRPLPLRRGAHARPGARQHRLAAQPARRAHASEQLKLVVDSYHDRRTAYQFILNPAGVKRDYYVYNDNVEDVTWDAVWDGAARVDSLGWVAEFRIPLSQLRFPQPRAAHLRAARRARRAAHRASASAGRSTGATARATCRRPASWPGFAGFSTPRRLEIAPYAVTKNVTQARPAQGSGYTHPQQQAVGADLKYGLTSNLTLDATINPDFGRSRPIPRC
jgi:hypothetical protein